MASPTPSPADATPTTPSAPAPVSAATTACGAPRAGGAGQLAGRTVSRVGFGAMQLPRLADDQDAALRVLRRAVELGVDHIDTAHFYGNGLSNDLIRRAIRPGDDVLVVSKVGATPDDGPVHLRLAQRPEELRAAVEDNLAGLGVEQIPVVNLRRADHGPGLRAEGDQDVDLDDQLAVMTALRDEGKIGAIGLSSTTIDVLRRSLAAGIVCVQNAYSIVSRDDEDMVELCRAEGIAWVPYFPLGGAFPGLPKATGEDAVLAAAGQLDASPAQIALAWLLHHAPHTLLIPGTADIDHLAANVAAGAIRLDAATLATLDAIPSRTGDIEIR
ncbi:aldo/keto reductase [Streptomyces sp. NPDC088785]|uniref:aldo/keto reductase n=1 Tax=Streptomyces sp. NPDC088785 TaxID=3365897 RepID=UPI0038084CB8